MDESESAIKTSEQSQSAEDFIAQVAPMTATSGHARILRELGDITQDDEVIEIWCGGGDLTAQLACFAGRVTGTDYSTKLIKAARVRFPDLTFERCDEDSLNFDAESFDVAVSNSSAHHFEHPEKIFMEARRVLRPGGRLLITLPIQSQRIGFNIVVEAARECLSIPDSMSKGGPLMGAERPEDVAGTVLRSGFRHCHGEVRVNDVHMASLDGLFEYAFRKIGVAAVSDHVRDRIRSLSSEKAERYRESDGTYCFPDRILAVRGET